MSRRKRQPEILIAGGGAGGLELATRLGKSLGKTGRANITLLDQNSRHVWKPILHEIAGGTLSATQESVGYHYHARENGYHFIQAGLAGIDRDNRLVQVDCAGKQQGDETPCLVSYDYLIVAVGSKTNDFGTVGVNENCLFLENVEDARRIHQILDDSLKPGGSLGQKRLKISVIGGGATGVQVAAELRSASLELSKRYRTSRSAEVTIVEAGQKILAPFHPKISRKAGRLLTEWGVKQHVADPVTRVDTKGVWLQSGHCIESDVTIWAAGVKAPELLSQLGGLTTNRNNQIEVNGFLQSKDDDRIYAIGDCAAFIPEGSERPLPPTAQNAHQQAIYLSKVLPRVVNSQPVKEYRFKMKGVVISLSRFGKVGTLGKKVYLPGFLAAWIYHIVYREHQYNLLGLTKTLLLSLRSLIDKKINAGGIR